MNIKRIISTDLDIPISLIDEAILNSHVYVKKFTIPKRKGGVRVISQPSGKLKTVQYWLIHNIFSNLPVHRSAVAYTHGVSILDNAERHKNNQYFLKIDFKDFFPSISSKDIHAIIEDWSKTNSLDWKYNNEAKKLVELTCFDANKKLPIGYPSSPVISNVVMYDFDKEVEKLIDDKSKYGEVIYTRYADDIVLSTNKKDVCKELLLLLKKLIRQTKKPNISINPTKTNFSSSSGGSAIVTGLRITADHKITIHKKHKDHIRLLLSLYGKRKLKSEDHISLKGHLSYIRHVAPSFYSKLQKKYFKEIQELLLESD